VTRFGRIMVAVLTLLALTVPTARATPGGVGLSAGTLATYTATTRAVSYDRRVPPRALASVLRLSGAHRTLVTLTPLGLLPNHEYGAHVHTAPCGPRPADSGPHFQHVPSADPAAANPANEIWLDFTTDATGTGVALATVDWTFTERQAHSVVIHEHHTRAGGGAGARLACLDVDFR
jgi:Cu-Zn family superoxide dismutase